MNPDYEYGTEATNQLGIQAILAKQMYDSGARVGPEWEQLQALTDQIATRCQMPYPVLAFMHPSSGFPECQARTSRALALAQEEDAEQDREKQRLYEKIKAALTLVSKTSQIGPKNLKTAKSLLKQIEETNLLTQPDPVGSNGLIYGLGFSQAWSEQEQRGMIAHEMGHIYHQDIGRYPERSRLDNWEMEYRADQFALDHEYGEDLAALLKVADGTHSHPPTYSRILRLGGPSA